VADKYKRPTRSGKMCKTCGQPKDEHPDPVGKVLGIKYAPTCDLVLVEDRVLSDGSGRVVTVETDKSPYERTRANNVRWIHSSRLATRIA
jgi:hypothetical protein